MFHYKKDHPRYNVKDHSKLFVKDPDNVLFNQFGMYILSEIPKMQNMKSFAVNEPTNIDEFVREVRLLPDGTCVNRFSKELFSYLETLVAFSPYYKINDPLMVGPFDQYYSDTLEAYGEVIQNISQQIGPRDEGVVRKVSTSASRTRDRR